MQPKVFISYSWSDPNHEDWVISLAQRLVNNGVDVAIDKWDLKEGHDKYTFMESMVNSDDINKVLIILDKKYAEKADDRDGGVGAETQIISSNIYEKVKQEKFIPIISELDSDEKPYIPTYLKGRIYIDLSSPDHFEANYEKLLRNILGRSLLIKPKLGNVPSYILEDTPITFKTTSIVRSFDSQMDRHPDRINLIAKDFFNEFLNNLKEFKIPNVNRNYLDAGKQIFENLNQYIPLRNDFIDFIWKISDDYYKFNSEILVRFFEKLPSLLYPEAGVTSWFDMEFDNFRFAINELFIYTIGIVLKNENYELLDNLINVQYFINDRYRDKNEAESYSVFNYNIGSLKQYYEQMKGVKLLNSHADFLIKRIPDGMDKSIFTNGDLFCYYLGEFNNNRWFPSTYVYRDEYNKSFDFFNRLISKRHFEKVKAIFNVESVEELKDKFLKVIANENDNMGYSNGRSSITRITRLIDPNLIASSK